MPKNLCGSVRWSRRRKDSVPKELCAPNTLMVYSKESWRA